MQMPNCPKCNSEYTYEDSGLYICPECFFEWTKADMLKKIEESKIKDAFGNELADGDTVSVIKDLKVKGASKPIKMGTVIKNIQLGDQGDGHDISCKVDGFGNMNLKSEFVKKV